MLKKAIFTLKNSRFDCTDYNEKAYEKGLCLISFCVFYVPAARVCKKAPAARIRAAQVPYGSAKQRWILILLRHRAAGAEALRN